jgi:hypothetical protein
MQKRCSCNAFLQQIMRMTFGGVYLSIWGYIENMKVKEGDEPVHPTFTI